MKRILTLLIALCGCLLPLQAQKYASVNTDYIFANIPDYAQAETQLNKLASQWQTELEGKQAEIDRLYKTYQQEAYLLPDNLKRKREDDIRDRQAALKELQHQRFGSGGDLDSKRAELLRPIQDRVYAAIERVANEKGYAFVFDRSGSNTVLFASSKYDISDQVLELLGYTPSPAGSDAASPKGKGNSEMMAPANGNAASGKPKPDRTPKFD
ncbi:MAG: OmpH family outer membrane protein [Bacteroidales bacterium]|nr:OmpH family outer membrane protein [Bacteroidales bacterium]